MEEDIDAPVQPLPHRLARRRITALEAPQRLGQMLDDGGRLDHGAIAIDQDRDLSPAGKPRNSGVLCMPFWKLTYRNETERPDKRSINATL